MDGMKLKATDDFMTYAVAVIKSRAIPLAEDGCKPIIRRILYAMGDMKLKPTSPTVKSAKVVGGVMGSLHPHGNASIYDAMVRLSQDWKMRYPLVEVQGNNGSLNGDSAAAERYTEARLTEAGMAMLEGLDPAIVPFVPNYDESTTEPSVLSGIFPNLLCNGTEGIAVGVSCSLVPHNLNNVIDLIEAHIEDKALSIDKALSLIKGPDFPLGGTIMDGYKLREIYSTGQGSITLRAKAELEPKTNSIKFSEFPYLVDVERIIKTIQDMVLEGGNLDILNYENHIGKDSCFIRIVCAKGANLNKVVNELYEKTPLEKTIKINNTVIHNGVPITASLLGLTNIYINHRNNCIKKEAKKELEKQKQIAHIQEGLLLATVKIDEVVSIIRKSDSKEEARKQLIKEISVDQEQADAILALQLGRLTKLDTIEIERKIKGAKEEIERQLDIIENQKSRNKIMVNDLERMRKKFGDERRTTIIMNEPTPEKEQEPQKVEAEYVVVDDSGTTYMFSNLENLPKGSIKGTPILWKFNKGLPHYFYNKDGTVETEWSPQSVGIFLFNAKSQFVVTISKNGIAKKTPISEYKKIQHLCKIKEGDELLAAFCCNEDDYAILRREDGKVNRFPITDIKTSGKLTIGTKIAALPLLQAMHEDAPCFFTITDKNKIKQSKTEELSKTVGVINNGCVFIGSCNNVVYWSRGKFTKIDWSKIAVKGKTSDGATISNSPISFS